MKKIFSAGLAILLPLLLTVIIVNFVINFLTLPFLNMTGNWFDQFNEYKNLFPFFENFELTQFFHQLFILGLLIGIIISVGLLGQLFLVSYALEIGGFLILTVPYVNKIYKVSKEVVSNIFSAHTKSFSHVVLAPYPSSNHLSLGLISKDAFESQELDAIIPVFIPGTPNPSIGYTLKFKKKELHFLEMKVEDAIKFVVSFGTVAPNFNRITSYNHEI